MLEKLPAEIAILIIEHDMDLVFRFAQRITVLVQGEVLVEGTPSEIARDKRVREVYLGESDAWLTRCSSPACAPATARPSSSRTSAFTLPERGSLAVLGRNGVGKTTLLATIMGHTTFHSGSIEFQRRPNRTRCRSTSARAPASATCRRTALIFPSLSVEENLTVAARPGRWNARARLRPLPAPRRAAAPPRQPDLRRRAADARDRPRADGQPDAAACMDEPLEGLAPIIVESLLQALKRLISEDSLAVVLVEQHAKLALQVTRTALVMRRGKIVHQGDSDALLANPDRLADLVMAQ